MLETKASGLPVIVADHAGTRQSVREPGIDGYVLPTADPALWERTLEMLLAEPATRRKIGAAARRTIETAWPSGRDVVEQDLLPVWRNAVPRSRLPANAADRRNRANGMPLGRPAE